MVFNNANHWVNSVNFQKYKSIRLYFRKFGPTKISRCMLLMVQVVWFEITFEKWADTLSGHDKVFMDMDRIV